MLSRTPLAAEASGSSQAPAAAPPPIELDTAVLDRLTAQEVGPVMLALRGHGIEVTALHNHMLGDNPRLFFMHFWANDDAQKLAAGLKAALSHIAVARG